MSRALSGTRFTSESVRAVKSLEFLGLKSPHGLVLHVRPVGGEHALCGAGVPASAARASGRARVDVRHLLVCFSCRSVYETAFGRALPQALE